MSRTPGPRLTLAAVALLGCAGRVPGGPAPTRGERRAPISNILRADYAGSQACAPCHPAVYAAWARSPMRQMTRLPQQALVRAPFDGRQWHYKSDSARLETRGGERYMGLSSADGGEHLYRVTKVIGGRYREDFAGVEVTRSANGERPVGNPAQELVLPLSYVFETGSFRLKGYSVMVGERPGLMAGGVWNQTCVLCHNTAPLFESLWGALHGRGAPSYQGVVVDRLLPAERRASWVVTDRAGLTTALRQEIAALTGQRAVAPDGGDPRPLLAEAARTLRERLVPDELVEVGIGCEACHGGSQAHVQHNEVLPSFAPRSPFLALRPAGDQPMATAEAINRTCARCHQVLFTRYPYTWEGGLRRHDPGGSHITSGEARDFLLGGCARRMSCVACHDPHGAEDRSRLQALATPSGNRVCLDCHPRYREAEALRAHAHHDPGGAGGSCVACHMPRKNMGLGYELTRYHRIGSPTDPARVEGDRPLECALCHPDRRVGELVEDMERWWGHRYDRPRLLALYGDLSAPVLAATAARGKPHEQATALAVMGEARLPGAEAPLAAALSHPYPLVRNYARRGLEAVRGAAVPINLDQDAEDIRVEVARWLNPGAPPPVRRPSSKPAVAGPDED
jgi:predicted CXXCH cytochrome family protein